MRYEGDGLKICIFGNNYLVASLGISDFLPYTYDKENRTITVANNYNFVISEDYKTITGSIQGNVYVLTLVDKKPEYLEKFGVYEGIYYNADNDKYACVMKSPGWESDQEVELAFENEFWFGSRCGGISSYTIISNNGKQYNFQIMTIL